MRHRVDETSAVYRHAHAARDAMRNLAAGAPNSIDAGGGNGVVDADTHENKKEEESVNSDGDVDNEKNKDKNGKMEEKKSVAARARRIAEQALKDDPTS